MFIAHEPISLARLVELTRIPATHVKKIVRQLQRQYRDRGINITHASKTGYCFTLATSVTRTVAAYYYDPHTLSDEATQTLALIAYIEPITQSQIEAHRYGEPSHALETLLQANLIAVAKSDEEAKHYVTIDQFLESASLTSLDELPLIDPVELQDEHIAANSYTAAFEHYTKNE